MDSLLWFLAQATPIQEWYIKTFTYYKNKTEKSRHRAKQANRLSVTHNKNTLDSIQISQLLTFQFSQWSRPISSLPPNDCCLGQVFRAGLCKVRRRRGKTTPRVRNPFSLQYSQVWSKVTSDPGQGSRCRESRQGALHTRGQGKWQDSSFLTPKPEQRRQRWISTTLRKGMFFPCQN